MSLRNSLNTGVSGLRAESQALGVIGDNVANVNTVGFKQSRAIFEDVLGGAVGAGNSPGFGVRMLRAQQVFGQGSLINTGEATDVALSGDGFFVVKGDLDGVEGTFFSRAGQLATRNDGTIVNPQGLALQGYEANADGTFSGVLGDLKVPMGGLPARATTEIRMTANLQSTSTTPAAPWDPANPSTTSNSNMQTTVYDSLGSPHTVNVYFRRTGANTWEYHALVDGGELAGGTAGRNTEIAGGTLTFNTQGQLQAQTTTGGTASFVGARAAQPIALNFGTPISAGGTGVGTVTQFDSVSTITAQGQDGYPAGDFSNVRVDSTGTVVGVFTNGQTQPLGRIAVARFTSNDGLERAGHNLWAATRDSGEAAIGIAGDGGRGQIVAGALEQSNVDLTQQFVELISHQRAFQANSKTITTADQMLQELMNLNR